MKSLTGLLLILLVGCAIPPQQHEFKKTFLLSGTDKDAAWSAIVGLFAERDWTITTIEKDSGIIASDWRSLSSAQGEEFADCGAPDGFYVLARGRSVKFNLFLRQSGQDLQLVINTNFRERRRNTSSSSDFYSDCYSRGTLEAYLFGEVSKRLDST